MKSLILLLALSSPAWAQTVAVPDNAAPCVYGDPTSAKNCIDILQLPKRADQAATIYSNGLSFANSCPDGYSLVYIGRPMCARELIEPK